MSYTEISVVAKSANSPTNWFFESGMGIGSSNFLHVKLRSTQRNSLNGWECISDTFVRPPVINAHWLIGTEKHPEIGIIWDYPQIKQYQICRRFVSCNEQSTKDKIEACKNLNENQKV